MTKSITYVFIGIPSEYEPRRHSGQLRLICHAVPRRGRQASEISRGKWAVHRQMKKSKRGKQMLGHPETMGPTGESNKQTCLNPPCPPCLIHIRQRSLPQAGFLPEILQAGKGTENKQRTLFLSFNCFQKNLHSQLAHSKEAVPGLKASQRGRMQGLAPAHCFSSFQCSQVLLSLRP